ncbi:MAG TPA: hypothetical protein VK845_03275 [Gemmatimonadales bacterium]|nr:hypothetical protein [Gemmatimonadales bacterium]
MTRGSIRRPPRWTFVILAVGGLIASGIYGGMMRLEGVTTGHVVRATVYGVFGLLMLWGALGSRH